MTCFTVCNISVTYPSNSAYISPLVMVPKKDGSWRMTVDFRELNKKVAHDPFPVTRMSELVEEFHGVAFLSILDMFWGFFHVKVRPEDTHKLALKTEYGKFEYTHLPMRLKI